MLTLFKLNIKNIVARKNYNSSVNETNFVFGMKI